MPWRVGVGGIWHETNTFAPSRTEVAEFAPWPFEGARNELAGALAASRRHGVVALPLFAAAAIPSGTVSAEARRTLCDRFLSQLEAALPLDGVVLTLHGAMVSEDVEDPESDLLASVRAVVGDRPLAVTLDLHANPGRGLLEGADVVVAYDTYPHVDAYERGGEAVELLLDVLEHELRPHLAWRKLPLLTCPLAQASEEEPMASLLALVHAFEERADIACASLVPGYPYADVERLGFTAIACGSGAEECVEALVEAIGERREGFARELVSAEEGVAFALAAPRGPIVLADVADNVGGGAPGNGTRLLAALLAAGAEDAVVVLSDPRAAALAAAGTTAELEVGDPPLAVRGRVLRTEEGRYRRTSSYMTGQEVEMGLCAVLQVDGVELVLTSRRVMPFDSDHLRILGIEPSERRILVAKSAIAWRAAFGDMTADVVYVDAGGVTTCRLEHLPYRRFRF